MPNLLQDSNYLPPIGIDITEQLNRRMAPQHTQQNIPLLELFAPSVLIEASAQSKSGLFRGMILGHENSKGRKFLYVAATNSSTALWMTAKKYKTGSSRLAFNLRPTQRNRTCDGESDHRSTIFGFT